MMDRLSFVCDPALDEKFPARRICRAEIRTTDGRILISGECEPRGEACENIGTDWLANKFRRITGPVLTKEGQEKLLDLILQPEDIAIRHILSEVNKPTYWK